MITLEQALKKYQPVIGLEVHVQMNTKTKMFCSCSNQSFNERPNINICPICMGFPGQLPQVNKTALHKAILSGLALGSKIQKHSQFDRKQYFYPDSPNGFQITQQFQPIAVGGEVEIQLRDGQYRKIKIHHMHIENDAGKLTHIDEGSLCDYNRAGSPLMEIVTEPDMYSIEEASLFAQEIQKIMRYCGSSNVDMEKGEMRFDLNVSLQEIGSNELGTKVETKNLNSFQGLEKAAEFEIRRQATILEEGGDIEQQTRGWSAETGKTNLQRSKEEALDYRYFPEPDIPPIKLTSQQIQNIQKDLPLLPLEVKKILNSKYQIEAEELSILSDTKPMSDFFLEAIQIGEDPKTTTSFITTILMKHLKEDGLDIDSPENKVSPKHLGELVKLIQEGTISNNVAKTTVFEEMYTTGKSPETIVDEKGLKQVSDAGAIEEMCQKAIQENPQAAQDVRDGQMKAIGALVGAVMKASKGQANPGLVNKTLVKILNN
jgi:aspartyl-tRNA(Asn)/glutamyl-tRNA(Gln) amidotransferase subunit B